MHLYSWRCTASGPEGNGVLHSSNKSSRTASTAPSATATTALVKRAVDEKQAEALLARALELEPFHVPTLTALAFVLLQRGGGGGDASSARAEELLDNAVKCAGPGGEQSSCVTAQKSVEFTERYHSIRLFQSSFFFPEREGQGC